MDQERMSRAESAIAEIKALNEWDAEQADNLAESERMADLRVSPEYLRGVASIAGSGAYPINESAFRKAADYIEELERKLDINQ